MRLIRWEFSMGLFTGLLIGYRQYVDEELLKVHRSYLHIMGDILDKPWLRSLSHITGGGIIENTHRVLEEGQDIEIDWNSWEWPEIFKMIQEDGNISTEDMIRPFNLGIGLILIIDKY